MFWKFRYRDCFGCTKQAELNSLRAAAKRFEDGTEAKRIIAERDKAARRLEKCEEQRLSLTEENRKLKAENRSLSLSLSSADGNYERLLATYKRAMDYYAELEIMQSDAFFARTESVVSKLNAAVAAVMKECA